MDLYKVGSLDMVSVQNNQSFIQGVEGLFFLKNNGRVSLFSCVLAELAPLGRMIWREARILSKKEDRPRRTS